MEVVVGVADEQECLGRRRTQLVLELGGRLVFDGLDERGRRIRVLDGSDLIFNATKRGAGLLVWVAREDEEVAGR
jgi:hypothetical protein